MARCMPCLGADIKEVLGSKYSRLRDSLKGVPTCKGTRTVKVCLPRKKRKGPLTKRQRFMKTCLKRQANIYKRRGGHGLNPAGMSICQAEYIKDPAALKAAQKKFDELCGKAEKSLTSTVVQMGAKHKTQGRKTTQRGKRK